MTTHTHTLQGYVNDMLAVERDLHAAVRRQKDDARVARYPAASRVINDFEETLDRHLEALRGTLARMGGDESALKKAVGSVIGTLSGFYDKVRQDDRVSRMLRDDYAALAFAIVCYEMLHTTALALRNSDVADVALAHLKDYAPLVMAISDVIPEVVIEELADEAKVPADRSVAAEAVRHTRDAWQAPSHA